MVAILLWVRLIQPFVIPFTWKKRASSRGLSQAFRKSATRAIISLSSELLANLPSLTGLNWPGLKRTPWIHFPNLPSSTRLNMTLNTAFCHSSLSQPASAFTIFATDLRSGGSKRIDDQSPFPSSASRLAPIFSGFKSFHLDLSHWVGGVPGSPVFPETWESVPSRIPSACDFTIDLRSMISGVPKYLSLVSILSMRRKRSRFFWL